MISLRHTYLSCALLAASAAPAFCTLVVQSDRSTWLSAVTSPTTIGFEGSVGNYSTSAGFTMGLVLPDNPTFVGSLITNGSSGNNLNILDHNASQYYNYGSGDSLWWSANSSNTTAVLHITWPTPVTAVAVDLMTYGGSSTGYNVKLNNDPGQVYVSNPTPGWPTQVFFGFTSDTPISSIDFYLPAGSLGVTPLIDNFAYSLANSGGTGPSDPSDTPEPSTLLLISTGLIGLAAMRKRFRHSAKQAA